MKAKNRFGFYWLESGLIHLIRVTAKYFTASIHEFTSKLL